VTIAVSYSDCAWNLQLTYTQVILKMMQFLVFKYILTYAQNRLIHKHILYFNFVFHS